MKCQESPLVYDGEYVKGGERAEQERQEKEVAQQQVEQERQEKELAQQQVEQERQRADRLAAQLRALNIDPD